MTGLFNFHTHCHYCDGSDHPEAYVRAALAAGFHSLGFSSHAPVPFRNNFAIKDEAYLLEYCGIIRELQTKYSDKINIYLALEMDYIHGISGDFKKYEKMCGLDYTIGSVHLVRNGSGDNLWFIDGPRVESYDNGLRDVFGNDIRKAVTAFYHQTNEMILSQKPDIIGHIDKVKMHNRDRYFTEDEKWYSDLLMETLDLVEETGAIIEVNTRGIYKKRSDSLYPGVPVLEEMHRRNMPVILSSDAHRPEEIDGYFTEAIRILRETGFKKLSYFDGKAWKEQEI
jgi:histidinol-phosphatase (PHP family)